MRISNIDTLSAYFDRLIAENVKLFFFKKNNDIEKINNQTKIISAIKKNITILIKNSILNKSYKYIPEKRTFDENSIIESLEELIQADINIGESDRARLEQVKIKEPNLDKFIVNEKRLRKANETRASMKNKIDKVFQYLINCLRRKK